MNKNRYNAIPYHLQHIINTNSLFDKVIGNKKDKSVFCLNQCIDECVEILKQLFKLYNITVLNNCKEIECNSYEENFHLIILNILNSILFTLSNKSYKNKKIIFIESFVKTQINELELHFNISTSSDSIKNPSLLESTYGTYIHQKIINDSMNATLNIVDSEFIHNNQKYHGQTYILQSKTLH